MVNTSVCIKCKFWGQKWCDYAEMTGVTKLNNIGQPHGAKACAFFEKKSGPKRKEKPLPENEDVKKLFYDGLSNAEIAKELGASHNAVMVACQMMGLRRKPQVQTNQFTQYAVRDKESGELVCTGNSAECSAATGLHQDSIRRIATGMFKGQKYEVQIASRGKGRGKSKKKG